MVALSEADRPSCPAAEEGGRGRKQHYIREWREASRSGLLGAGIRARRFWGAVRRPSVTLLSHCRVFLEL